ncbi:hypothetical protein A6M27_10355 [Acidithiobacillus thiooxidans]|uniref:hypothetical protein n=1 Tax=Acidithiobacillus thiooxidans TaxID=930 RepID=UPI000464DFCC|nr:hypothetical protein [Acidithiobacillus thiooxidans]OCX68007.1 hypothetical protein A6O24_20245 [Acidithiobacillus thiooxidans]OCX83709.1 hypothetical protein A6O26_06350 [Acidithiobacillus thiooxidans]OCX87641.1 hypothetical protein A6M27_10355 [Acidithiobacillus thiooxidans]OFC43646.1 hypothetical protein BAE47_12775 [Acidithiobacillus thiooxidans]
MALQYLLPELEASPQEKAYLREIERLNKMLDMTERALKLKTLQCSTLAKEVGSLRMQLHQLPLSE